MARIRSLKPEFWPDEKLATQTPLTRLVFLGLISQADDAGRLVDSVRLIDGLLFPLTDDTCDDSLDTLAEIGVIQRGLTASGQRVIQIKGWVKHQKIDKPNLRLALPPVVDVSPKRRRRVVEESSNDSPTRRGGTTEPFADVSRPPRADHDPDPDPELNVSQSSVVKPAYQNGATPTVSVGSIPPNGSHPPAIAAKLRREKQRVAEMIAATGPPDDTS
jgi:hypothetical protein